MVGKQLGADAQLVALFVVTRLMFVGTKTRHRTFARRTGLAVFAETVRLIIGAAFWDLHLHLPVALEVHDGTFWRIDRQLMEIGCAETGFLRIEIAEQTPLEQGIVGEIDAWHDVGRAECYLFGFGKEIVWIAIKNEAPHHLQRQNFFGNDLGGIQNIVGKAFGEGFVE